MFALLGDKVELMKKKQLIYPIVICIVISLLLAACNMSNSLIAENKEEINDNENEPDTNILTNSEIIDNEYDEDFKIMILTGSTGMFKEEFYSAEKAVEMYGSDRVTHKTLPESPDFYYDPEMAFDYICAELLEEPSVKVLIMNPAIEYFDGMLEKIRKAFPNLLIIAKLGNLDEFFKFSDIATFGDEPAINRMIAEYAKKMGAKTIVYYYFPRYMDIPYLVQQRDLLEETCMEIGLKFVYAEAFDTKNDTTEAQQFIIRDVSRKVNEFGKDTFF